MYFQLEAPDQSSVNVAGRRLRPPQWSCVIITFNSSLLQISFTTSHFKVINASGSVSKHNYRCENKADMTTYSLWEGPGAQSLAQRHFKWNLIIVYRGPLTHLWSRVSTETFIFPFHEFKHRLLCIKHKLNLWPQILSPGIIGIWRSSMNSTFRKLGIKTYCSKIQTVNLLQLSKSLLQKHLYLI